MYVHVYIYKYMRKFDIYIYIYQIKSNNYVHIEISNGNKQQLY